MLWRESFPGDARKIILSLIQNKFQEKLRKIWKLREKEREKLEDSPNDF